MFRSLSKILSGLIVKERKPKGAKGKKPVPGRKARKRLEKQTNVDSSPITGTGSEEGARGKSSASGKMVSNRAMRNGTVAPVRKKEGVEGSSLASNGNRGANKVAPRGNRAVADGSKAGLTGNRAVSGGDRGAAGSIKRKVRKNKHGIPLLSRKDLSFGVEQEPAWKANSAGEVAPLKKPAGSGRKDPQRKGPVKKDKNGFPILAGREDLYDLFSGESIDRDLASGPRSATPLSGPGSLSNKREESFGENRDRHGLPLIDDGDDLFGLFDADRFDELNSPAPHVEGQAEEDDFEKMIEESIGKKSYRTLLLEKDDNLGRKKPLTMAQKLKSYPDPQGQLDLHGYTAYKAEERTDSYILQELRKGTKTVRIIVGRGLHSEGRAVLPDVVEDRIVALKKKGKVFTFKWENGSKAKSGAMVVYLT